MTFIFFHESDPIAITPELMKRIAWGTHFQGPQRQIVRYEIYLHGLRRCKGELLECGHIVIPSDGYRPKRRRCPLCHRLRTRCAL